MARPKKCKIINLQLEHFGFTPEDIEVSGVVFLNAEELQAIKLKDIDGLGCIEGAKKMGISKSTFANLYNQAHRKISTALINGYKIEFKC